MKLIKHILITLFFLITFFVNAQRSYETNPDRKRGFNWLFGDSIWLDFKTNPPTQRNGSQLKALESSASISDTAGNLLFYTDGVTVWNAMHQIIQNGTGLNGNESSSQGCLFIPQPNNDSVFYLFTTDWQGKSKGFCYHTIILDKQNMNKSRVKDKNIKLLPSVFESISATTHANGLWKWIVVRNASGKGINAFLLTDKGINICPVYSETQTTVIYDDIGSQSVSAFSNDGKNYIVTFVGKADIEFLIFNNTSGSFSINGITNTIGYVYSPINATFANDNKNCFVAERDQNLYKFNCIEGGQININNHNDSFMFVGARLTPYNQIYFNIFDSMFLGLVDKPELANAKFKRKGLLLNKKCTNGLTNFDNSYNNNSGINFTYSINCSKNKVQFKGQDSFNANSFIWKTKLITSNNWINIGSTKNINYTYNDSGLYHIQLIANKGIIKDTLVKTIWINKPIKDDFLGRDTGYCTGSFPSLKLQLPNNLQCFKWNVDSIDNSITVNKSGTYIATITTNSFCQISDTINLYEDTILSKPYINRIGDSLFSSIKSTQYRWLFNGNVISNSKAIRINQLGKYQLEVFGKGGCYSYSDTIQINKLDVLNNLISTIKIYPTPSNNYINISGLNINNSYIIKIADITGKIQLNLFVSDIENPILNIENLTNGLYFITIVDNHNNSTIQQLIKQ